MFQALKKFVQDHVSAVRESEKASRAAYAELISESRLQTALLQKRDNELYEITSHLSYLSRVEADKRQRSGHPVL